MGQGEEMKNAIKMKSIWIYVFFLSSGMEKNISISARSFLHCGGSIAISVLEFGLPFCNDNIRLKTLHNWWPEFSVFPI